MGIGFCGIDGNVTSTLACHIDIDCLTRRCHRLSSRVRYNDYLYRTWIGFTGLEV